MVAIPGNHNLKVSLFLFSNFIPPCTCPVGSPTGIFFTCIYFFIVLFLYVFIFYYWVIIVFDFRFLTIAVSALFFGLPPVQASSHSLDDDSIRRFFQLSSPILEDAKAAFGEDGETFCMYAKAHHTEAKYDEKKHHLRLARLLKNDNVTVPSVFLVYDALRTNFDVVNYALDHAPSLGLRRVDRYELIALRDAMPPKTATGRADEDNGGRRKHATASSSRGSGVEVGGSSGGASASASAASASGKADAEDTEVVRTPIARGGFIDQPDLSHDDEFYRYVGEQTQQMARAWETDGGLQKFKFPNYRGQVIENTRKYLTSGISNNCLFRCFSMVNPKLQERADELFSRSSYIDYLLKHLGDPKVKEYLEVARLGDNLARVDRKKPFPLKSLEDYLDVFKESSFNIETVDNQRWDASDLQFEMIDCGGIPIALAYLSGVNLEIYSHTAVAGKECGVLQGSQMNVNYKHPDDDGTFITLRLVLMNSHYSILDIGGDDNYTGKAESHELHQMHIVYANRVKNDQGTKRPDGLYSGHVADAISLLIAVGDLDDSLDYATKEKLAVDHIRRTAL